MEIMLTKAYLLINFASTAYDKHMENQEIVDDYSEYGQKQSPNKTSLFAELLLFLTNNSISSFRNRQRTFIPRAIIVFTAMLVGISYFVYINLKTMDETPIDVATPIPTTEIFYANTYTPIDECSSSKCLFKGPEAVEGLGKVVGYYHQYQKIGWGDEEVTCDALIITGGADELIDDLIDTVKRGNGINSLTLDGKLILTVSLDESIKKQVTTSSETNPIELTVVRTSPQGRGAPNCGSFVEIINSKYPTTSPKPSPLDQKN